MTIPYPNLLKRLLTERHLQNYPTFCREYDRHAAIIDSSLVGTHPSRAQFYRWISGEVSGLPYPDHCRVLESILPGNTAKELFGSYQKNGQDEPSGEPTADSMVGIIAAALRGDPGLPNLDTVWSSRDSTTNYDETWSHISSGGPVARASNLGRHAWCQKDSEIARFIATARILRLNEQDAANVACLRGNVVDLDLSVFLDIQPDGWATVTYDHIILNMSSRPLSRLARETWFENTRGPLEIHASLCGGHTVSIERVHDTKNLAKFACNIAPPLLPYDHMKIGYSCRGGQFVSHHYWRQLYARYTRWATIRVKHHGAAPLAAVSVAEEHADGFVALADNSLMWEYDGADVSMTVVRDYLRPNQSLTLRWERGRAR